MKTCTLTISSGFIAGVPHRNPDLTVVGVSNPLRLEPEPSNNYDPSAIKIIHEASGQFLGYIPREQTPAIHAAQAQGFETRALVSSCQPQTKWKEVGYVVIVTFNLASPIAEHPKFEGFFGPDPRDPNF